MNRTFLIIASIFGCTAVMLGAFGAHTLREMISEYELRIYEKGVTYQFYHTFALFISILIYERLNYKCIKWSGYCFIIGILLFSGSLYLLALSDLIGINKHIIGPITPLGGAFFIAGWICLLVGILKIKSIK